MPAKHHHNLFPASAWPTKSAWRQAIRMTAAALLAYGATGMVGLQHGYWAVITCLVIVQGSLGATINAGWARVVGTAAGAVIGGLGALALRLYGGVPEGLILFLVIIPLALLAASKIVFRMAPLTGALVLLLADSSNLGFAFSRVAEIALGTLIGVVVSLLVLPERATGILVERAASLLECLGELTVVLLSGDDAKAHEQVALRLRSGFAQLQNDMKEVAHERNARLLRSDPFPEQLARHVQRLRTDVNMLGRAVASEPDKTAYAGLAETVRLQFLDDAAVLRGQTGLPELRLREPVLDETSTGPLGFAVLTLQMEFKALRETLLQRATEPAGTAVPGRLFSWLRSIRGQFRH